MLRRWFINREQMHALTPSTTTPQPCGVWGRANPDSPDPDPRRPMYRNKLGVGSGVVMAHLIKDMLCVVRRQLVDRCAAIIIRYICTKLNYGRGIMRSSSTQQAKQNFSLIIDDVNTAVDALWLRSLCRRCCSRKTHAACTVNYL